MADWHADPDAVSRAVQTLRFELRRVEAAPGDIHARARLFHATGQLCALDATGPLARLLKPGLLHASSIADVLDREEMVESLEESAVALRERLREHQEIPPAEDDPTFESDVLALLRPRDRAEIELLGAAAALRCSPEEAELWTSVRLVFDEVVRPEIWRLVELNDARQTSLAGIAPRLRRRFWWWYQGAGIHPSAVASMSPVARLVATFPGARQVFESLVRAQGAWASSASPAEGRNVRSLRRWLARRPAGVFSGVPRAEDAPIALAAAPADELTVLETADVEISFCPPRSLVIDLLSNRAPGAAPTLRLASGRHLRSASVVGSEERFVLDLPDEALDGEEVSLHLPLSSGGVDIVLPPRDDSP